MEIVTYVRTGAVTHQDSMGFGDVPAPVQVNAFAHQRVCIRLGRPEHPPRVSLCLHPGNIRDDLVVAANAAHAVAGHG